MENGNKNRNKKEISNLGGELVELEWGYIESPVQGSIFVTAFKTYIKADTKVF